MSTLPCDPNRLRACATQIVAITGELAARGWTPATSSNFSLRLDERHAAITISGRDKGRLGIDDVMLVDLDGNAVGSDHRPSAETLLHTQLYRRLPDVGCVLHTHSLNQTLASRLYAGAGHVRFTDYELIKAFRGQATHATTLDIPVLANNQHIPTLAAQVDVLLDAGPLWGYLIEGHGAYAWGADVAEARRHLDALEFLLACELEMRKLHR
ncbi:MAG: methylthioribulose 1-phosphate dehydratase [Proteobacteria bacterium]|nr:methylthioribulose 1-phosphate dehydratase [Pseudomonadota bacterium]MBS0463573.1 methylthioribulose 1-phosphate dehydratase [Pseudomonadota bacterium]